MIETRSSQSPLQLSKIQDEWESCVKQTKIKEIYISTEGLISIDQLKNFIIEAIKKKSESSFRSSSIYANPYSQRIDNLKMSKRYQPPKF